MQIGRQVEIGVPQVGEPPGFRRPGGAALICQLREVVAGRVTRVAELGQPVFAWR